MYQGRTGRAVALFEKLRSEITQCWAGSRAVVETFTVGFRDVLAERRRRRELAGGVRAGSWARAHARNEQRTLLKANWRLFAATVVGGFGAAVALAWLMPNHFLSGVVVGAGLVFFPGAIWFVTVQMTGTASSMMGDDAEQWTAAALRRLSRAGWCLVNHVALSGQDVDHVLLGPGGAFAIETKWSSSWDTEYGYQRLRDAVSQSKAGARRLGLWHEFRSLGIEPQPVVVLWGRGLAVRREAHPVETIDGATVIVGDALKDWTAPLGQGVLSESEVTAGWSALDAHAARRDPVEHRDNPMPLSLTDLVVRMSTALGVGALGILTVGQLFTRTTSILTTVICSCAVAVPAGVLARRPRWRWAAAGWLSGLGLTSVALLAATFVL